MVKARALNARLAGFSYSLYAVHYPLLLFALTVAGGPAAAAGYSMRLELGLRSGLLFTGAVMFCLAMGWLFALVTERKTGAVRRWLNRSIEPRMRPAEGAALP